MENYTINYVVALYFGERMSKKHNSILEVNQYYLLEEHLKFICDCKNNIRQITFVINGKSPADILDKIKHNIPKYVDVSILQRENVGFSYAGWNDVIINDINNNSEFDYYFLIEDDFVPNMAEFYKPFVKKCTDKNPFVCNLVLDSPKRHPAMPHGLIQTKSCKKIYEKYNTVFLIYANPNANKDDSYKFAWKTQTDYYDYFINEGYTVDDITDEFSASFHNSQDDSIRNYGDERNLSLLNPILSKY